MGILHAEIACHAGLGGCLHDLADALMREPGGLADLPGTDMPRAARQRYGSLPRYPAAGAYTGPVEAVDPAVTQAHERS